MRVSRRTFLAGSASATAAAGLAAACSHVEADGPVSSSAPEHKDLATAVVGFDGLRQAGVATATQAHLNLAAFNLKEGVEKPGILRLLRLWTEDARKLCTGSAPVGSLEPEMNAWPANLTITAGIGERVFDLAAPDAKPQWLHDLPAFSRDRLDPAWGQSDLVLQICSDDPLTCAWALRHMTRAGMDYVRPSWVQQGFMNASGSLAEGTTPRNLFGQVDGTVNPRTDEAYEEQVWIDGPGGFAGSTSLVVRRIAMDLDEWEVLDRRSREVVVGRSLADGAPLTGGGEFAPADMEAVDDFGLPVIDKNSHMARAMPPEDHPEQRFRRRPYNYNLPPEPGSGKLSNAGLIFIAYQKDPDRQFTPVQARLDEVDRLNTWITHIGSAVYWVPPGASPSGDAFWGQSVMG
ncbi:Dye-decolorizing peroxidase precursor [Corynebacterium capitovis DSM 44611]|uniref:Dyp-type peroxidase n=1 Tax=Corynebacterium capitovis TaxID=131081 RepID=UPI00037AB30F|nr:Dyp-type peroxidase [Corynebacterium capitovis]WKD57548.1 Dye-decolorizing peroxidase precursor [Corynebacterium capitovis DSM 44611]